jgi:hypothetical protein
MFDFAEPLDMEHCTVVIPRFRFGAERVQSKLASSKGNSFSSVDDIFETLLEKDENFGGM